MAEVFSDNLSRFNEILQSLPLELRLKISSLSLLDNVSTQLLRLLVSNSGSPQTFEAIEGSSGYPISGERQIFQTLLRLFKEIRLIYNDGSCLLNVHNVAPGMWLPNCSAPLLLRGHETYIMTTIRKANLLTYMLTILGCFDYGFDFLQESFFEVFCPNTAFSGGSSLDQNGKLLKSHGILYLGLKTQAYISGLKTMNNENKNDSMVEDDDLISRSKCEHFLDLIFPNNLDELLILRRTDRSDQNLSELMTPSEREFIERCIRRRENLSQYTSYKSLTQDYSWYHFIKELLDYINKNMGVIILGRKSRGKSTLHSYSISAFDPQVLYASGEGNTVEVEDSPTQQNSMENTDNGPLPGSFASSDSVVHFSAATKVLDPNTHLTAKSIADTAVSVTANHSIAIKKVKPKRTWSKEEEDALVEGLKAVGPSWSKILDIYGPGGKISEALKNRSQVQLKDKARNWKLHYLKSGRTLPEYLVKVTGTLERTFRSKKKNLKPTLELSQRQSNASDLFRAATTEPSDFDPSLQSTI
ncbi:hypothetical protein HG535_0F05200 [Zygotorulaspora mrakii]|uniref:Uncharacterized protein n=1 Tax=Zygotorulaspora mrakii TaxID=42260 RepID=A0A7H9B5M6_ZYGMR|nr:uncharacterized protein HG535_0F05200 [Zygotorulaspora mrakii]QLG74008.1 hypothetical protein HG535_0F05200 [Zygotorulaspora mrakii]